jgi:putative ABC transport system substrate-binding protein
MRRRDFMVLLGAAAAWPLGTSAQQPAKIYKIGILESIPADQNVANLEALRNGLRSRGYVEGQNLTVEYRSANGSPDRFPELASELVRLKVDLIVTRGTPATNAAKNATTTIPTLMATMGDPHALVTSFARPGGNITGVTTFSTELIPKRIEILKELVPGLARIALLHNLANPAVPAEWEETKAAARALGLGAELLDVRNSDDLARAFEIATRDRVDAVVVGFDGLTQLHQREIAAVFAEHKIPAVYPGREFVQAGGLVAYAVNYPDLYFRLASLADKILRGANPGDLPVEQPARFELIVNLSTARTLGLAIPPEILGRADEVIE